MAAKGNKNALGNKGGGRPSSFRPEFVEWAEKFAKLGATDADLAASFEVSEVTIGAWKKAHPEFSFALKKGKAFADANVADSLYKRATGYEHPAVKILVVGGGIVREEYVEHYPPDATSMIFWLKNRRPDLWRDKRDADGEGDKGLEKVLAEILTKLPG